MDQHGEIPGWQKDFRKQLAEILTNHIIFRCRTDMTKAQEDTKL